MSRLYDLPFDQYQRYKLVSTLVEELRGKGESLSILDVGGRTALLRSFLKHDRVTLVDLEPSSEKGLVLGDGAALPFADKSFDLVCAFDTLEHVPVRLRARFVRECARVTRRFVVLAGPYQSPEVEEAEQLLQKFLHDKLGVRHRYLEEHRHHGLPEREATQRELEQLGARVVSLGHGNLQRWLALISLAMYMDHTPALQAQAVRLHRFYNRGMFEDDEEPPVYRHALVAAFGDARLPAQRPARKSARPPARELLQFAQELAAFDAHRDGYQAEFERLQAVIRDLAADLEGHKRSLDEARARRDEAQRVVAVLTADLAGHKHTLDEVLARRDESEEVIATLRADLAGHKQSLEETRARRSEALAVIEALERDLAGHRASLEELLERRAESERVIAALQVDLEGHRGSLQELSAGVTRYEGLLAEHRSVIAARELELARHGRVLEELRANLAALDAEQAKVLGLRENERREFEAVRVELQQEIGALQGVRGDLEHELQTRESHAAELAQLLAREHEGFAAEQERVRLEQEAAMLAWEAERKAFEGVIADRESQLARHVEQQGALRAELEQHRAVLALRERELAQHKQVVADLRSDLDGHRALVEAQRGEIAGRDAQLAQRVRELGDEQRSHLATRGELAHARDQVADLGGALEGARAEIRAAAAALAEQERLIGLLRSVLRNRLRSLRRALGPARPTPGE